MKIVFLCSSLEPGRDGVGDYTRRLSIELLKQGHQIGIVALNDRYITIKVEEVYEKSSTLMSIIRFPSIWSARSRFNHLTLYLKNRNPDWLSLQFVPFGFDNKGLIFGLSNALHAFGKKNNWQVMFHELWVGMDEQANMKHVYWGWLQRQLIRSLLIKLKPKVIHTQTRLYQKQLFEIGFKADYLPLFGNIPLNERVESKSIDKSLVVNSTTDLTFVLFGGIHSGAPIKQFAEEAADLRTKLGIVIKLLLVGRNGHEENYWVSVWKAVSLPVESLGGQSPDDVSKILSIAHIGLATTPVYLIEKSGSVAAMLEHGLPILCVSRPWNPRGFNDMEIPEVFFEYKPGNLQVFVTQPIKRPTGSSVVDVARQFIDSLTANM